MDIMLGWNLYFRIILSILSRTGKRIVESQDISGHLKRLIDFTIELKKMLKLLHFSKNFSLFLVYYVSVSSAMFIKEVGLHLSQRGLVSFLQSRLLKYLNLSCLFKPTT